MFQQMERYSAKLIAAGGNETGANSLLYTYTSGSSLELNEYLPLSFENEKNVTIGNASVNLYLLDVTPAADYSNIRMQFYPLTNIVLLVFAISKPKTFQSLKSIYYPEIINYCGDKVPILVVGCFPEERNDEKKKNELKEKNESFVSYDEGKEFANSIHAVDYCEFSYGNYDQVEKMVFELLVNWVDQKREEQKIVIQRERSLKARKGVIFLLPLLVMFVFFAVLFSILWFVRSELMEDV